MQPSRTRIKIQRGCNPPKEVELNPYWLDFEKGAGERDALTWADGGVEYDMEIRNSVCGKDNEGGNDGPFNTDGFTKESKSTTTSGGGGGRKGSDDNIKGQTTTSSSLFLPVGETSLVDVVDDDGTTNTPPLLSSTSPDDPLGQAIDTSFISTAPSPTSIVLHNNVNNNYDDQATTRSDAKNSFIRRRTRKPAAVG